MDIKSGLKALTVVAPLTMAPVKSAAQTMTKEVSAPTKLSVDLGLGYGRSALFWQKVLEPKVVASVGVSVGITFTTFAT